MALTKEIKVGIVGAIAFFLGLFIFIKIKQSNLFTTNMVVTAKYDRVNFIQVGHPVHVNGQAIGVVSAIYKDGKDYFVDLDIDPATQIPKTAKAAIMQPTILGGRAIYIYYEGTCNGNCLQHGDQIEGYVEGVKEQVAAAAGPVLEGFGKFADQFSSDSAGMKAILDKAYAAVSGLKKTTEGLKGTMGSTAKTFPVSMSSLRKMTQNLSANFVADADQQSAIDSLLATISTLTQEDIDAMTKILYTANEKLPAVPAMVDKAKVAITKAEKQIDKVNTKLSSFEEGNNNMIAKLLHDENYKDSLQVKINGIAVTLGKIRANPEKYISLRKKK